MGNLSNESFESFLDSLKEAGITITREQELRERLAEAQVWRYAFMTLASNGRAIGISFVEQGGHVDTDFIHRTFAEYRFPESSPQVFKASLKSAQ